jgi:hypothetical protein
MRSWRSTTVRLAALEILNKEETLSVAQATSMLSKPKPGRSLFFVATGLDEESVRALNAIKRRRFKKASIADLEGVAASDSPDRDIAWLTLAERKFVSFAEVLRNHLDDRFVSFHASRWGEERQSSSGAAATNALLGLTPAADAIRRRDLIRSALDILLKRRAKDDLYRLRRLIDEEAMTFGVEDVLYLRDKGDWTDIERLAAIGSKQVSGLWNLEKSSLILPSTAAILKISHGRERDLLARNLPSRMLASIVASVADNVFSQWEEACIGPLLQHTDDAVRRVAALKIVKTLKRSRARAILTAYLTGAEQRYYNVILWLDLARAYPSREAKSIANRALAEGQVKP